MLVAPPANGSPATTDDWRGPCPTITPAEEFGDWAEGRLKGGEVHWFTWELPPGRSYNFVHLIADGDTALRVCVAGMEVGRDFCRSGTNPGQLPEGCGDPVGLGDAWVLGTSTPSFGRLIYGPAKKVRVGVFSCTTGTSVPKSTCPGTPGGPALNYELTAGGVTIGS